MWNTMYPFQVKEKYNFFVRKEIAREVFKNESSFKRRGIPIQVTKAEDQELRDIEGSKTRKFFPNKSKMVSRITEILEKQGGYKI